MNITEKDLGRWVVDGQGNKGYIVNFNPSAIFAVTVYFNRYNWRGNVGAPSPRTIIFNKEGECQLDNLSYNLGCFLDTSPEPGTQSKGKNMEFKVGDKVTVLPPCSHKPIEGKKFDSGKPMFSLIPICVKRAVVDVLMYGVEKYGKNNWRNVEDVEKYVNAMERHWNDFQEGIDIDKESGLNNIDQCITNLIFISWNMKNKPERDWREK